MQKHLLFPGIAISLSALLFSCTVPNNDCDEAFEDSAVQWQSIHQEQKAKMVEMQIGYDQMKKELQILKYEMRTDLHGADEPVTLSFDFSDFTKDQIELFKKRFIPRDIDPSSNSVTITKRQVQVQTEIMVDMLAPSPLTPFTGYSRSDYEEELNNPYTKENPLERYQYLQTVPYIYPGEDSKWEADYIFEGEWEQLITNYLSRDPENLEKIFNTNKSFLYMVLDPWRYRQSHFGPMVDRLIEVNELYTAYGFEESMKEIDGKLEAMRLDYGYEPDIWSQDPIYTKFIKDQSTFGKYATERMNWLNANEMWLYSFWYRRWKEGNHETTIKILKEIQDHYGEMEAQKGPPEIRMD